MKKLICAVLTVSMFSTTVFANSLTEKVEEYYGNTIEKIEDETKLSKDLDVYEEKIVDILENSKNTTEFKISGVTAPSYELPNISFTIQDDEHLKIFRMKFNYDTDDFQLAIGEDTGEFIINNNIYQFPLNNLSTDVEKWLNVSFSEEEKELINLINYNTLSEMDEIFISLIDYFSDDNFIKPYTNFLNDFYYEKGEFASVSNDTNGEVISVVFDVHDYNFAITELSNIIFDETLKTILSGFLEDDIISGLIQTQFGTDAETIYSLLDIGKSSLLNTLTLPADVYKDFTYNEILTFKNGFLNKSECYTKTTVENFTNFKYFLSFGDKNLLEDFKLSLYIGDELLSEIDFSYVETFNTITQKMVQNTPMANQKVVTESTNKISNNKVESTLSQVQEDTFKMNFDYTITKTNSAVDIVYKNLEYVFSKGILGPNEEKFSIDSMSYHIENDAKGIVFFTNYKNLFDTNLEELQSILVETKVFNSISSAKPTNKPEYMLSSTATPQNIEILVDNKKVDLGTYIIDNSNYVKLRDVASFLNNSDAQFDVGWDNVSKLIIITEDENYIATGNDLKLHNSFNTKTTVLDHVSFKMDDDFFTLNAYKIDGYNYLKLRDLSQYLDFDVDYDSVNKIVIIKTK